MYTEQRTGGDKKWERQILKAIIVAVLDCAIAVTRRLGNEVK